MSVDRCTYLEESFKANLRCTANLTTDPDHESRDRDVVLVRRTISFGETPGSREIGKGKEWGGNGEGEVSLRATWGQGGRDRTTQKEGFQVSKREWKGN
jgi:hypothetical protein